MTPQQEADAMLREYQANREAPEFRSENVRTGPLPVEQWGQPEPSTSVAVRDLLKAHGMENTVDNTDELLLRLAQDRAVLLVALKEILAHVEDMEVQRMLPNQCTLCHTYRMIGHDAIELVGRK